MKQLTCEVGEKFGYWEVIDNTRIIKSGHAYVLVKCKCGKEELKCLSYLKNGEATGCRNCKARERSRRIKIGDKFKQWTVIDGPISTKHQVIKWLVQCSCGKTRWIQGNELTDPNKCFTCLKCAQKIRGEKEKINNGKIGDLDADKFGKIRKSAEARDIPFSLTIRYLWDLFIKQNKICAITGDYIPNIKKASLDRIDSSKGYIEGNVQWVTKQANLSKHTMTIEQLHEFCRKVLDHANQQPSQPLTKLEGSETNS